MRSRLLLGLIGSASPLVLLAWSAPAAYSQDSLTITTELTAPVQSATAGPAGGPADVVITTGTDADDNTTTGAIVFTEGTGLDIAPSAAFVLNSDNSLINEQTIAAEVAPGAIGVLILTPEAGLTGSVNNQGVIRAGAESGDTVGANFGLVLDGSGSFTGSILGSSQAQINVFGDSGSATGNIGIDLRAPLVGDLQHLGAVTVIGPGQGLRIAAPVTGRIETGLVNIQASADAVTAVEIAAPVTGELALGALTAATNAAPATGVRVTPDGTTGPILLNGAVTVQSQQGTGNGLADGAIGVDLAGTVGTATLTFPQFIQQTDADGNGVVDDAGNPVLIQNPAFNPRSFDTVSLFVSNQVQILATGPEGSAIGVLDRAGSLNTILIDNGGLVSAAGNAGGTAFDLRANAGGVQLINQGSIVGGILLGDGDDTVIFEDGEGFSTTVGDVVDFGGGANRFVLDNIAPADVIDTASLPSPPPGPTRSTFVGTLTHAGSLDLEVNASDLTLTDVSTSVTNALFTGDSNLTLFYFADQLEGPILRADQQLSLSADTDLFLSPQVFPVDDVQLVILDAATLSLDLAALDVTVPLSELLFDFRNPDGSLALSLTETGGRQQLILDIDRVPTAEFGLNSVQTALLDNLDTALLADPAFGLAFANIGDTATLQTVLNQVAPQSSGSSRAAGVGINTGLFGVLDRRFETLRDFARFETFAAEAAERAERKRQLGYRRNLYQLSVADRNITIWGQEFTQFFTRDAAQDAPGFDGFALNFAVGVDTPLFGLDAAGLYLGYAFTEGTDDDIQDGNLFVRSVQAGGYLSKTLGGFFADLSGGATFNDYENSRTVTIPAATDGGTDFTGSVTGDWTGIQYGGNAQLGYRVGVGRFGLSLAGTASYQAIDERAYDEVGPLGLSFEVDERDSESLRVGGRARLEAFYQFSPRITLKPEIRGGILHELIDDPVVTTVRSLAGGPAFTLSAAVPERTSYVAGLGLAAGFSLGSISLDYDYETADDFTSHNAGVTVRFAF